MDSATRKLFTTPEELQTKLNEALEGLDNLRATLKDFYKERGITAFDISSMSATDFLKHVQVVVLTCNPPKVSGFVNMGEYLTAVKEASREGGKVDPRLTPLKTPGKME